MSEIYKRIEELCAQRGIRPGRVSADLGLSRGFMTDLKMDRKKTLNAETAAKIAAYLDVPVETLMTGQTRAATDEELRDRCMRSMFLDRYIDWSSGESEGEA